LKADLSENKTRVAESEETIVLLQQENAELKESVEQGNFIIQGLKNEYGHGIIRNYTKAFGFYQKAVDNKNPEGYFSIARLYERGKGIDRSHEEAALLGDE
jgi:TPR repeat protein